nr:MAG TPA: hypothetical protein [Caudoviricetes sp.]
MHLVDIPQAIHLEEYDYQEWRLNHLIESILRVGLHISFSNHSPPFTMIIACGCI